MLDLGVLTPLPNSMTEVLLMQRLCVTSFATTRQDRMMFSQSQESKLAYQCLSAELSSEVLTGGMEGGTRARGDRVSNEPTFSKHKHIYTPGISLSVQADQL